MDGCGEKVVRRAAKTAKSRRFRQFARSGKTARRPSRADAQAADASAPFEIDAAAYLAADGAFAAELSAEAERIGLKLTERDGSIFSYPVLVRRAPDTAAIRVDKTAVYTLKPSVVAALLKKLQARDPKSRPERFLETLYTAYDLVRRRTPGAAWIDIPLTEIHAVFTLRSPAPFRASARPNCCHLWIVRDEKSSTPRSASLRPATAGTNCYSHGGGAG